MPFAELVGDYIVLRHQWSEQELIKSIPGAAWKGRDKRWVLPLSWGTCLTLRGVFGAALAVGPQLSAWSWQERHQRIEPSLALRDVISHNDPVFAAYADWTNFDWDNDHCARLFPHQMVGREWLCIASDALLADDMGVGKTVTTLAALRRVQERTGQSALPALVVCPNSLKGHWERQTAEWLPEAHPYVVRGSVPVKRKTLLSATQDPFALVIINIESVRLYSRVAGYGSIALKTCRECDPRYGDPNLSTSRCERHHKELNRVSFRSCVLDEAHRVKDPYSQQTRAIWYTFMQPGVQRRWALTGTPIASHAGELWSVMHAVSPTEYPVKSKFLDRYAHLSWNGFGRMDVAYLKLETKQELFGFLDPRLRRMIKSVVTPQLPPKTRIVHEVEMTPKQAKAYREIHNQFVTTLDDGTMMVARGQLAARTRLLQLAGSYIQVDEQTQDVRVVEPSPKIDVLMALLQDLGATEPGRAGIIVSSELRGLLELASARLNKHNIPHVMITGTVPEHQRADNLRHFQEGDVPVMMFTHQAGGEGLDMSCADTVIRIQRSWSLLINRQSENRAHRIGSDRHKSVTIIDLVTSGTVEVDQMRRLATKLARLEEIVRDRERLLAAGLGTQDLDREEAVLLMQDDLGEPA